MILGTSGTVGERNPNREGEKSDISYVEHFPGFLSISKQLIDNVT